MARVSETRNAHRILVGKFLRNEPPEKHGKTTLTFNSWGRNLKF
jgi:hypothetical protein